jgi:hypothetical protein
MEDIVYIVFTTGMPLCHEVLPQALARGVKIILIYDRLNL